jgi:hypothetical protein
VGWNTGVLFVRGLTTAEAVASLAEAETVGHTVEADVATSGAPADEAYAAVSGGWAQVWTTSIDLLEDYEPEDDETALFGLFGSVSGIFGFRYFEDGEFRRQLLFSEGATVLDQGEPLPVEATTTFPDWGPDEDFVWSVIESVTGVRLDPDLRYEAFRLVDG